MWWSRGLGADSINQYDLLGSDTRRLPHVHNLRRRRLQGRMGRHLQRPRLWLHSWRLCSTLHELAYSEPVPQVIALDMPIGLPERGPRACDLEARRLLGPGRASSVFPAPIRPVLVATSYDDACQIRLQVEGKKLSRQAWVIVPKIREVDDMLRDNSEL
jgi:hypothetical protein